MKKLALVAALSAALPVLAHADVTIYGTVAMGIDSYDNGGLTKTQVDDFGSKIGFKGNEDLGNGLKSVWQVESGFDADGSAATYAGTFASRQSYVGLQSNNLGTVRLGKLWDVMVQTESTDTFNGMHNDLHNITYPVYENGFIPGFSLGSGTDSGAGAKNSIVYDAPNWNGFTFGLQYSAGENKTTSLGANDRYGIRFNYTNAATNLFVGGAFEASRNQTAAGKTGSMSRLETGYNGEKLNVAFTINHESIYADTTVTGNGGSTTTAGTTAGYWNTLGVNSANSHLTANSWGMLTSYAIGSFTPKIEYSQISNATIDGKTYNTNAKLAEFAVDYSLSKRTTVEAAYTHLSEGSDLKTVYGDSTASAHTVYLALIHSF